MISCKSYNKKHRIDYEDTFSLVAKMVTIQIVLAIASVFSWPLFQLDVMTPFIQGDLHEEVYMDILKDLVIIRGIQYVDYSNPYMV